MEERLALKRKLYWECSDETPTVFESTETYGCVVTNREYSSRRGIFIAAHNFQRKKAFENGEYSEELGSATSTHRLHTRVTPTPSSGLQVSYTRTVYTCRLTSRHMHNSIKILNVSFKTCLALQPRLTLKTPPHSLGQARLASNLGQSSKC